MKGTLLTAAAILSFLVGELPAMAQTNDDGQTASEAAKSTMRTAPPHARLVQRLFMRESRATATGSTAIAMVSHANDYTAAEALSEKTPLGRPGRWKDIQCEFEDYARC